MNLAQRLIMGIAVVLLALRVAFPVRESYNGLEQVLKVPTFMLKADWTTTSLHVVGIMVVAAVLAVLFR